MTTLLAFKLGSVALLGVQWATEKLLTMNQELIKGEIDLISHRYNVHIYWNKKNDRFKCSKGIDGFYLRRTTRGPKFIEWATKWAADEFNTLYELEQTLEDTPQTVYTGYHLDNL